MPYRGGMARQEPEEQLEIRLGNKFGAEAEGGLRGCLALSGPAPVELGRWLAALTFHPLPPRFGRMWVYQGGRLLGSTKATAEEDMSEARARSASLDVDAMENDATHARQIAERLDLRVAGLRERIETARVVADTENTKLLALRQEHAELLLRVDAERQRVAQEVAMLDASLAEYRRIVTEQKAAQMADLQAFASNMAALQSQVSVAFQTQLDVTVTRATQLEASEAAIVNSAMGRKLDAVHGTNGVLEILQKIEEGGLHTLLPNGGGDRPPTPKDKLLGAAAEWVGGDGLGRAVEGGIKLLDKLLATRTAKPAS